MPDGPSAMNATVDRATVAFTYGFPFAAGGVESHVLSLVEHGDASRFRWLLVGTATEGFRRQASLLELPIVPWRAPRWPGELGATLNLLRVLKRDRVSLVHVHGPRGLVQAAVAARLAGIPVVSTVHLPIRFLIRGHGAAARFKVWAYSVLDRVLLRHLVARTIFVASSVCRESVSRGLVLAERARVVRNGVSLASFGAPDRRGETRRALGIPESAVTACFVGRLEAQKGVDTLIEAVATLAAKGLGLHLLVVGDGSLRPGLEGQVRAHGLQDRVRFLSFRQDVGAILAAGDLFVLPSRFEAMPIALVEAMATGLPSVVTDVGDNAELMADGTLGLVVPPGDPPALAGAMEKLALDSETRRTMGTRAREAARAYSVEAAVRAVERVYAEALGVQRDETEKLS